MNNSLAPGQIPGRPILRDYQAKLEADVRAAFAAGAKRVLVVLPTGGGKTVTFSSITFGAQAKARSVLAVVHRIEIVRQIVLSFNRFGMWPGIVAPGHTTSHLPVQVGMIQTAIRRLEKLQIPGLIIIDEAHHAVSAGYMALLAWAKGVPVIGVTATPLRLDGRGLGEVFDKMIVGPSTRWLIDNGYLADYDYYCPQEVLDMSNVRTTAGDYNTKDLQQVVDTNKITGSAVDHYKEYLNGCPAIAFCVNIDHCYHVAAEFVKAGWKAAVIEGNMKPDDRSSLVNSLATGGLNVLVSCDVVSEGFDVPVVAGAILLRPTKSLAFFLQSVGRALRLKPDGSRAVILDHVANVKRHGLPDDEREWSLEKKPKKPVEPKTCEKCFKVFSGLSKKDDIWQQCPRTAGCTGDRAFSHGCPLLEPRLDLGSAERALPETVDGKLSNISLRYVVDGKDMRFGPLRPWLEWAGRDRSRLVLLAEARKYKRGWVYHAMQASHG